jgi:hypothetical protein
MKLGTQQEKFAEMIGKLICHAYAMGYKIRLGASYVAVVKCPYCGKKVSKHCFASLHHIKLGQDINLFKKGKFLRKTSDHKPLGLYWESIGGTWGGRFKDGNHYSLQYGKRK